MHFMLMKGSTKFKQKDKEKRNGNNNKRERNEHANHETNKRCYKLNHLHCRTEWVIFT